MDHTLSFDSLLIIILLATFVPILIKKIKWLPIPIVVGEIIAGMIVGKSGFQLIEETPWLSFLYTFGFAFLMFLSGLEVDFNHFKTMRNDNVKKWYQKPIMLSILIFIGTLIFGTLISYSLYLFGLIKNIPIMTLILSTTSLGIVVPTLKEKGLLNSEYGQVILLSALVADFMTMVMVTVYISFYTEAATHNVLLILLLFVFFFIFYRMGLKIRGNKIIQELTHATSQIKVRGAFSLILIFIALTRILGTEIILGTFLAGLVVSLVDEREGSQLYSKLDAIGYGFFIPIFFVMVGVKFDMSYVISNPNSIYLLPALLLALYIVKILPTLLLRVKFPFKESFSAGFLLSSRLSLIIATSAIGLKLGIISEETNGVIILTAIITCTFSPLLFNKLVSAKKEKTTKNVCIIGVKQKTLLLANKLKSLSDVNITFITHNPENYKKCLDQKHQGYLGDPLNLEFLKSTNIQDANIVVISKNDSSIAKELTKILKEQFNKEHVMLLVDSQSKFNEHKDITVISPEYATVFMAENLILNPKTFSLFSENAEDSLKVKELYLRNSFYFNQAIRKFKLPGDCLILSIMREDEKIIPNGNTILKEEDLIMLIGTSNYIQEAEVLLGN